MNSENGEKKENVIYFSNSNRGNNIRLEGNRLIISRSDTDYEFRAIKTLRKLKEYILTQDRIIIIGEFFYIDYDYMITDLDEKKAHIKNYKLIIDKPIENEEKLINFLENFKEKSKTIPETPKEVIRNGKIKFLIPYIAIFSIPVIITIIFSIIKIFL